MSKIDLNVNNYSISELLAIIGIDMDDHVEVTGDMIIDESEKLIDKYKNKNNDLTIFLQEIRSYLLDYIDEVTVEGFTNKSSSSSDEWYKQENLSQKDKSQKDKITDREQKVQVFDNEHLPMKREQIANTDTFSLPVKQDSLNPNLKNTINRFINLDSQFRQFTSGTESQSTNYTCDLSDTLKNALKLSLYSYQIPFSWYAIDKYYGNTCFWIHEPSENITVSISIPSGNYSQSNFITQLNNSFAQSGFIFPNNDGPASYNSSTGMVTLFLKYGYYNGDQGTFSISSSTQLIFFDFTGNLQCNINCISKSNHYFNNTLGWLMGYRVPYINVDIDNGNTGSSILDLTGTKYLILAIDDYNQNHVNNSLVSISQFNKTLKLPSYYSPDLPSVCIKPDNQGNIDNILNELPPNTQNGLLIAGKYEQDYTDTQIVLPSAPRTLTNAQLYNINAINANNNNLTNYLSKAPTTSDILAVIPVKTSVGVPTGSLLVEFSGSLQDNERTYFGPVNIERMAIKLLDDKGNVLNLNGNDWCVTLIAECLYQY